MSGKIHVNVVCARNIPGEWMESADPYIKLRYGDQHRLTRSDTDGGRNPNFNQRFVFDVLDPPGVLEIGIFHSDVGFDDFLAKGVLEMSEVLKKVEEVRPACYRNFFPLKNQGGNHHGDIELEFVEPLP